MLTKNGEDDDLKSLEDYTPYISKCFEDIHPWVSGSDLKERNSWLLITGVPVHAWKDDLFKVLGQQVGNPGHVDENTVKMKRLDVGIVLISTSYLQVINTTVRVKINDMLHPMRLMQDSLGDTFQFRRVEVCSSAEGDLVANNMSVVPEMVLSGDGWKDDLGGFDKKNANSKDGRRDVREEGTCGWLEVQLGTTDCTEKVTEKPV